MVYTVHWKALPSKAVIRTETYDDLEQAVAAADIAMIAGPKPVEITVTDSDGVQHFQKVMG